MNDGSEYVLGSKRRPVELLSDGSESECDGGHLPKQSRSARYQTGPPSTFTAPIVLDNDIGCSAVTVALSASSLCDIVTTPRTSAVAPVHYSVVAHQSAAVSLSAPTNPDVLSAVTTTTTCQEQALTGLIVLVSCQCDFKSNTLHTEFLGGAEMHGCDYCVYTFSSIQDINSRFCDCCTLIVNINNRHLRFIPRAENECAGATSSKDRNSASASNADVGQTVLSNKSTSSTGAVTTHNRTAISTTGIPTSSTSMRPVVQATPKRKRGSALNTDQHVSVANSTRTNRPPAGTTESVQPAVDQMKVRECIGELVTNYGAEEILRTQIHSLLKRM